jgi:hypothetical protein
LGSDPACANALRELCDDAPARRRPAPPVGNGDGAAPAHVVAAARQLWAELAGPQDRSHGSPAGRAVLRERFERRQRDGRQTGGSLVERFRALVCQVVPAGATIAVISRGDARLVALPERTGWHLPQVSGGTFAGHHPADSAEALQQLEALRGRGAAYLAVPATDLWWLAYYGGLRDALARDAALVAYHHDVGAVYRLTAAAMDDLAPGFVAVLGSPRPAFAGSAVTR